MRALTLLLAAGLGLSQAPPAPAPAAPGCDNQPMFSPDGGRLLCAANRDGKQSDIYAFDRANGRVSQLTRTAANENSPTFLPAGLGEPGGFSVGQTEPDHLALFILGQPATLQLARVATGTAEVVARDIGRALHRVPGTRKVSFVQRESATAFTIKEIDVDSRQIAALVGAVEGSSDRDYAWMPDGRTVLMSSGPRIFSWTRGAAGWNEVFDASAAGLGHASRLNVSPTGDAVAIVVAEPKRP